MTAYLRGQDKMKTREIFLDRLRTAAACAVVMLHTITGVTDTADMSLYPGEEKLFLVIMDLVCWCVPVFLIISGYLFLNPARELTMKKMLTVYCRRILLALFVFGVPYAWLEQIALAKSFRPDMVGKGFLMVLRGESWSHMWYLYLILVLYLLTPAMKWILARVPRWTVYLLLAFLLVQCSLIPWLCRLLGLEEKALLPGDMIYFFYYISGYLFARQETKRQASYLYLPIGLLAAGMVCSRLWGSYSVRMAYNYPFTAALSLLLFAAGKAGLSGRKRGKAQKNQEKEGISALSFTVYLIHPVFLNLFYKFLGITPLSFPAGISLPLFFLGTLLLSGASAWVLYRIPPLRKYVL